MSNFVQKYHIAQELAENCYLNETCTMNNYVPNLGTYLLGIPPPRTRASRTCRISLSLWPTRWASWNIFLFKVSGTELLLSEGGRRERLTFVGGISGRGSKGQKTDLFWRMREAAAAGHADDVGRIYQGICAVGTEARLHTIQTQIPTLPI